MDRQLAGHSASTPFMSMQDTAVCNKRHFYLTVNIFWRVKLTSILPLCINWPLRGTTKACPSNLRFIMERGEDTESLIMIEVGSEADTGQTVETDSQDHLIEVDLSMNIILEKETFREGNFRGRNRWNFRNSYRFDRSRTIDRHFLGNLRKDHRSSSRSKPGSRTSSNKDRIRCFRRREYDHFAKDFPKHGSCRNKTSHIRFNNQWKHKTRVPH